MEQLGESNRKIYYSIVDRFLRNNKNLFTNYEIQAIKHHLLCSKFPEVYHKDVIREIFDHLALLPVEENLYIVFMNELLNHCNIEDKRIVEVGGGIFPNLAQRLTTKLNKGTITVYDPRLDPRVKSNDKMVLKKELFTRQTELDDCDLVIGLMPCKGIDVLLDQAVENKKDFMVWFCEGGPHGDYFDYFEDEDEWYHCMNVTLENGLKRQNMGKVKKIEYPHFSRYPIIYNSKE